MVSRTLAGLTEEGPTSEELTKEEPTIEKSTSEAPETVSLEKKNQTREKGSETAAKHPTKTKDTLKLSVEECLYLATVGGAKCLNLETKIGGFERGMWWDAQLIVLDEYEVGSGDDAEEGVGDGDKGGAGPVQLWGGETWNEKVAKWLFCGDERCTRMVFVGGRLVNERG